MKKVSVKYSSVCILHNSHLQKRCEKGFLSFTLRSQHIQKQAALTVLKY